MTETLPARIPVYDALNGVRELVPTQDEVAPLMAEVGARPEREIERDNAA